MSAKLVQELDSHREKLTGHCYRMLGSTADADDAVQETMVRALRSIGGFDGRSCLRTWMYRIATNVCLDALSGRSARVRPVDDGRPGTVEDVLEERARTHWLEPVPDTRVIPPGSDPGEAVRLRQSVRLAFVAALQHLPPRQRAALLMMEVLGFSAVEVAEILETTVPAINSAVQRARAALASRDLGEARGDLSPHQLALVEHFAAAFEAYDVDALAGMLREDAVLSMPPYTLWLRGPARIRTWLLGRGIGCRGSRLLPTAASGLPAFGQYRRRPDGSFYPWSLVVLELHEDRIASMTHFLDTKSLFPLFALPESP